MMTSSACHENTTCPSRIPVEAGPTETDFDAAVSRPKRYPSSLAVEEPDGCNRCGRARRKRSRPLVRAVESGSYVAFRSNYKAGPLQSASSSTKAADPQ